MIADDHGVLRAGLRALLSGEYDLEVVGEAMDGDQTFQRACEQRPDLILLDIAMPGWTGIEVTRRLRETLPATRVLILTFHEDVGLLREAIKAGASGYVPKRAIDSELISAIRTVSRGGIYVHPALTQQLLDDMSPLFRRDEPSPLTPREIEVLRLIAQGHTSREIAKRLNLSIRTVDSHRANLASKLGFHERSELVRYATQHGLIN